MLTHAAKQYVEQQVIAEATALGFRPATSWYHGDLWRSGLELGLWDTDTNPEGLRSHAKNGPPTIVAPHVWHGVAQQLAPSLQCDAPESAADACAAPHRCAAHAHYTHTASALHAGARSE